MVEQLFPYPLETIVLVYVPVAYDDIGFLELVAVAENDEVGAVLPFLISATAFRTSFRIDVSLSADKSKLADLLDLFDLLDLVDLLLCILPCESRTPIFFFRSPFIFLNAIPGISTNPSLVFNNSSLSLCLPLLVTTGERFVTVGEGDRVRIIVEVLKEDLVEGRAEPIRVVDVGALPLRTAPFIAEDLIPKRRVLPKPVASRDALEGVDCSKELALELEVPCFLLRAGEAAVDSDLDTDLFKDFDVFFVVPVSPEERLDEPRADCGL